MIFHPDCILSPSATNGKEEEKEARLSVSRRKRRQPETNVRDAAQSVEQPPRGSPRGP